MIQVRKRHTVLPLKILLGFSLACHLLPGTGSTNLSDDGQPLLAAEDRPPTLPTVTSVPSAPGERAELSEGFVNLRVDNSAPYERIAEPVTSGIPLPAGLAVTDPDQLVLIDAAGNAVAAQYTVTARWGGAPDNPLRPIRWLLADFQASVPANGSSVYTLAQGKSLSRAGIRVLEHEGGLTVDTGAATFLIGRQGWLERVALSGQPPILSTPGAGVARFAEGSVATANASQARVELTGPMRTVVKVTGRYANGLEFTTRYWFYSGKALVRIFHTVENNNTCRFSEEIGRPDCFDLRLNNGAAYGQVDLEDLSLVLTPSVGGAPVVATEGRNLPLTADISLYQDSSGTGFWNLYSRLLPGAPAAPRMQAYTSFRGFRLTAGTQTVAGGDHSAGALGLSGAVGSVTIAVRDFWQNFPKALRVRANGQMEIGLFPSEFAAPHRLRAGEHKSTEFSLEFFARQASVSSQLPRLNEPLLAMAPATWFAAAGVFGPLSSAVAGRYADYEAYNRYTLSAAPQFEGFVGSSTSLPQEIARYDFYGWQDYGDVPLDYESGTGPMNLKYNFDLGMWLQFVRTGDANWRALAEPASRHFADIDILHQPHAPDYWAKGGAFGHSLHDEPGIQNPHRNYQGIHPDVTFGVPGMLAAYYLTGYEKARAAALEVADNIKWRVDNSLGGSGEGYAFTENGTWDDGARPLANALRILTEAYRATGQPGYLQTAQALVAFADFDRQPYRSGPMRGAPRCEAEDAFAEDFVKPWQLNLYLLSLGHYLGMLREFELRDPVAERTLTGNLDFLIRFALHRMPDGGEGFAYLWCFNGADWWNDAAPTANNWLLLAADAMAYGYKYSGNSAYLTHGEQFFLAGSRDPFYYGDVLTYHSTKEATNAANFGLVYQRVLEERRTVSRRRPKY